MADSSITDETIQAFSSLPIPDPHSVTPAVPDYYASLKNFQVEKKIGQGQFSVVFRAKCVVDGRIVALKKIQVIGFKFTVCYYTPWPTLLDF